MANAWNVDVALLVLRLGVAYVFLDAAWENTKNAAAWNWTVNETALLFRNMPDDRRQKLARLCSIAGMVMMYGGGLSVLIGVEPVVGGAMLAAFSMLGMRIHAIRRDEAKQAADGGNAMGWSAYSAHIAAGLKNWALAAAGVAFVLVGTGRFGLRIDLLGPLLGLR
jgi:uncharacterized membrane protein YphA (DoxX/SURF4 family)